MFFTPTHPVRLYQGDIYIYIERERDRDRETGHIYIRHIEEGCVRERERV